MPLGGHPVIGFESGELVTVSPAPQARVVLVQLRREPGEVSLEDQDRAATTSSKSAGSTAITYLDAVLVSPKRMHVAQVNLRRGGRLRLWGSRSCSMALVAPPPMVVSKAMKADSTTRKTVKTRRRLGPLTRSAMRLPANSPMMAAMVRTATAPQSRDEEEVMTLAELVEAERLALTLPVEEAAELLDLSRSSAYRAVARGEIPTIRLGRRLLVPSAKRSSSPSSASKTRSASRRR